MKKYYSSNEALNEILVNNGIVLNCNDDMEIVISDEDAARIPEIVREQAEAAINDYSIEEA